MLVPQRSVSGLLGEFLLHLPFREKGCFLWEARVCACYEFYGERETTKFLKGWRGTLVTCGPC